MVALCWEVEVVHVVAVSNAFQTKFTSNSPQILRSKIVVKSPFWNSGFTHSTMRTRSLFSVIAGWPVKL
ncbi:hypothetical protein ACFX12_026480 [Malus domestica]